MFGNRKFRPVMDEIFNGLSISIFNMVQTRGNLLAWQQN
jgi:hypothetical protein